MRSPIGEASMASTFSVALAKIAVRGVARVLRALKHRGEVARLTELDDRALKDIGLLRSDVHAALAMPLSYDPSFHLIEVAGHKRAAASGRAVSAGAPMRLRRPDAPLTAPSAQSCPV